MNSLVIQWAAISAVVGVLGLAIVIVTHIVKYSFNQGVFHQRLQSLEQRADKHSTTFDVVTKLEVTVNVLDDTVKELKNSIKALVNPRARRLTDER